MKNIKSIVLLLLTLTVVLAFATSCDIPEFVEDFLPHEHAFAEGKCECGETDPNYVAPHEHAFVEGKCECGAEDPNYVPPHEHSYTTVVTAPTCTEAGFTTYTCACGDTYKADEVAALGHKHTTVVTAPTCTEAGFTTYTCACGDTYKADEVPATGHKFINGTCTVCGEVYVPTTVLGDWTLVTELKDGDRVLIGVAAYGKLLSAEKVSATSFYNKGVDYSATDFSGVTDAEIFVVTVNADGTYTFTSVTGDVIALAASYSSLNKDGEHKTWTLTDRGDGTFLMKNVGRNTYLEWYSSKDNWSTYTAGNTDEYYISFYAQQTVEAGDHVHNHITEDHAPTCTEAGYTSYTCACGDTYKVDGAAATGHSYTPTVTAPTCTEVGFTTHTCACGDSYKTDEVPATGHNFVEGKCECGEKDASYVPPFGGGSADFNTIVTSSPNGDSSYTKTFTTTNGWIVNNSAIQCGGTTDMNPQFTVIGANNTFKAICLNGKTSAPGSLTSPTLVDGVSKIVIKYTKMFTDTDLSVTITVTDSNGNKYTDVLSVTLDKNDKYTVYTYEWVLETPVTGDFTIEIVNNCPTAQNSNKDRITILDLTWEGAAPKHEHSYENVTTTPATCTTAGVAVPTCSCGDTLEEVAIDVLPHVDTNLDITCDYEGCTKRILPAGDSKISLFTANHMIIVSLSNSYYVEGVVTKIYDANSGIFVITDEVGDTLLIRLPKDANGTAYASWATKVVLGDTISVYGKPTRNTSTATYAEAAKIEGGLLTVLKHEHSFSDATCTAPATCTCLAVNGEALGHIDENADNLCDRCPWKMNLAIEHIVIRTDAEGNGVLATDKTNWVWAGENFDATIAKGQSTYTLYTTAKAYMQLKKANTFTVTNKSGKVIDSITIYASNATQLTNLKNAIGTAYTYTADEATFSVTIALGTTGDFTFDNAGSSTVYISGVDVTYEK